MAKADLARTELTIRCAIYTRKSSDEGLEQEFNSLGAQREACEAYCQWRAEFPQLWRSKIPQFGGWGDQASF